MKSFYFILQMLVLIDFEFEKLKFFATLFLLIYKNVNLLLLFFKMHKS